MQYTSRFVISTLAFITLFKWSDAKRMSDEEARRKLYTLAELLDAEIAAREELTGRPLTHTFNDGDSQEAAIVDGEIEQFPSDSNKHQRLVMPEALDEIMFPVQNAKRATNRLRVLANNAARGFGKR